MAAHCLQLRKRPLNPFKEHVAGSANFEADSKEIAKEILILRKELAEDVQNSAVSC
jgi:hypothetical protein